MTRNTERELEVVEMRIIDQMTFREIAEAYGLSPGRVQQIEARGVARLRGGHTGLYPNERRRMERSIGVMWVNILALFGEPGEAEQAAWDIFRGVFGDPPWGPEYGPHAPLPVPLRPIRRPKSPHSYTPVRESKSKRSVTR